MMAAFMESFFYRMDMRYVCFHFLHFLRRRSDLKDRVASRSLRNMHSLTEVVEDASEDASNQEWFHRDAAFRVM